MEAEEKILRKPSLFGNGAHVFVPKHWVGEQLIIIKQPKKSLNERILQLIAPHLEDIVGAYLYGSYARGEQNENSDIDLLVVANKKIDIKEEGFEVHCIQENNLQKLIKFQPVLFYSIFSEAKSIINAKFLQQLKTEYRPKSKDFEEFVQECKRFVKINLAHLESEKGEYYKGDAVIYSLILRLRGLFIIKCLLKGEKYTSNSFKEYISSKLPKLDFDLIYQAYQSAKSERKFAQKVKVSNLFELVEFLKLELSKF